MNLSARPLANRSASRAALLLAAVGCVLALSLLLALTGRSRSSVRSVAVSAPRHSAYTLMQWNLCLSGLAGCYRKVAYPAAVDEAAARIREVRPDAVTFNEACQGDVALIARRTDYNLRFSRVIYLGAPLRCIHPGSRGLFGDAVLTKATIASTDSQAFEAQAGVERRQWLCLTTRAGVDVCTAHLSERSKIEVPGNDGQCAELTTLLAGRAAAGPVIFGGDVNRRASCAPDGFWTRTDRSADQTPGLQQVYGTDAFRSPSAKVLPAAHSDHDILLVRAHLTARR